MNDLSRFKNIKLNFLYKIIYKVCFYLFKVIKNKFPYN